MSGWRFERDPDDGMILLYEGMAVHSDWERREDAYAFVEGVIADGRALLSAWETFALAEARTPDERAE